METGLLHIHSALRYLILGMLIFVAIKSWVNWLGKKPFQSSDRKLGAMAMGLTHIQLLIGLVLYVIKKHYNGFAHMKELKAAGQADLSAVVRFWTIEHLSMMLLAIILITVGHSMSKRALTDQGKYMRLAIFFTLGLVIIFAAIPWPFFKSWGTWF
ncbi:MAG: hypothetical protein N2167_06815 [Flavobacteriales bacterium]|nr:hypothetical protein [Flavobacteriales bacterium]